jgi:hypothetical protein
VERYPFSFIFSDKMYLKIKYRKKMKRKLNLDAPVLFSEKIQWLKLYDRNPTYAKLVDKYEVRKYITETIGEEFLIPCLGVWDSFDEINFDELPEQFVLKCTHDSGSVFICKNKKAMNIKKLRKHFNKRLLVNYYYSNLQWAYKNVKPRIIAEKYMVDDLGGVLKDFKFLCFNGEPKLISFVSDTVSESGTKRKYSKDFFYDPNWQRLNIVSKGYAPDPSEKVNQPKCLDTMLEIAKKLSADKAHVRVDFFLINDKPYFGELTFYNYSGYTRFNPPHWDKTLGDWLTLPPKIADMNIL